MRNILATFAAIALIAFVTPVSAQGDLDAFIRKLEENVRTKKRYAEVVVPNIRDEKCPNLQPAERKLACIAAYNAIIAEYVSLYKHTETRIAAYAISGPDRDRILAIFKYEDHDADNAKLGVLATAVEQLYTPSTVGQPSAPTIKPTPASGQKKNPPKRQ